MTNRRRMFYRHIILQFNKILSIEESIALINTANKITLFVFAVSLRLVSLHNWSRSLHNIACIRLRADNCVAPLLTFLCHWRCHHELEALCIGDGDVVLLWPRDLDLLRGCE